MVAEVNPRVRLIRLTTRTDRQFELGQLHLTSGDALADVRLKEVEALTRECSFRLPTLFSGDFNESLC